MVDPNAVVGVDYQTVVVERRDGQLIAGTIESETATALTLRTPTDRYVVPKSDIANRTTSSSSLMPPGLLGQLSEQQAIELIKFLTRL